MSIHIWLAGLVLWSVAVHTGETCAAPRQDSERRTWQGFGVTRPITSSDPQWAQDQYQNGAHFAIWINELVSNHAAGVVSDAEFLSIMRDGQPNMMRTYEDVYQNGEEVHDVTYHVRSSMLAIQGFGIVDIVDDEPVFFDLDRFTDSDGNIIPGRERDYQAAREANAIMKEVYLLRRRIIDGDSDGSEWTDYASERSCKRVRLAVPAQATPEDIHVWAEVMRLSEAQQAHFLRLHEAYAAADDELRELLIAPVLEQFEQLKPQLHRASSDIDVAEQIRSLQQRISAAVQQIIHAERIALFDEMASVLIDPHLTDLNIVRARRMRDVYKVVGSCLDGASVDLSELFPGTIDIENALAPAARNVCRETLTIYEGELTELHRRHHDAKRALMTRGPMLKAAQQAADDSQRQQSQYDELLDRVLDAERSILELNERYLPTIYEHLPEDVAAIFADAYHVQAYPQVYPNPYDLSGVIAAACALEGLTEKQREELKAIRDLTSQQQERICSAMSQEALEWEISLLQRFTIDMSVRFAHYDRMDSWHTERREACELGIESLYGIFDESQTELIRPEVQALRSEAAQCLPRITGIYYSPAAPPSKSHVAQ